jgi:acetyl-CoA carboxylase biotin carboxyl carrier protein
MDLLKIKQLIDVLAASDLSELELTEGDHRVRLIKRVDTIPARLPVGSAATTGMKPDQANLSGDEVADSGKSPTTPATEQVVAPLFGVLHLAASPDAPAFVNPGDAVQPGQVLCIVESMKVFHEVKSTGRARIIAVLAQSGHEVEAGQALFELAALGES